MAATDTNIFKDVAYIPTDHAYQVNCWYKQDTNPNKVNFGLGAFRDDEGKPWVLPVVRKAELQMCQGIQDGTLNHEYLGIDGLRQFSDASNRLVLGADSPALAQNRVCGVQCLGGTGSLRLAFELLARISVSKTVFVSKPTWGNHVKIVRDSGFKDIREYRYYDAENRAVDFGSLCSDLEAAPESSIIILHAVAHNPTGVDLSQEQWKKVAEIMKKRQLLPVFDTAYQGFASGDVDEDAWAVRYFVSQRFELFVGQSFSKNFGLYGERVGNLCVVTIDNDTAERIRSQLKAIARPMFSKPPDHGARIVATVLCEPVLYKEWLENLKYMHKRMQRMRQKLYLKLKELETPGTWDHIVDQKGMFSFTGLNLKQIETLRSKHHIYLLDSGRMNICGLTPGNLDAVARSIHDVVCNVK